MTSDHIKMPDIIPFIRYIANGTETDFTYPFPVFASEDMMVRVGHVRQYSGFDIIGAGDSDGGIVTFDHPPKSGAVVTLERRMTIERLTDFLEGGDFSARALNNELDFLTAAIQQVQHLTASMLRYHGDDGAASVTLPPRAERANKALGFDASGNPVAIGLEGAMQAPDFTAPGINAVTRTSYDKFSEQISVKDFGAAGDGVTDDTHAIQSALEEHARVYVPPGLYVISAPIVIALGQSLYGAGASSIISCNAHDFAAIEITGKDADLHHLRIENGLAGVKLFGRDGECTKNHIYDLQISDALNGIILDGYRDTNKPCYWNNFNRIVIERPLLHGVHLYVSDDGDTPNANRFHMVRVYSKGAETDGAGFYVEDGALNNAFIDCEANMNGTASACFRVGENASKTLIINFLAEAFDLVPNVQLDNGSSETVLINLTAMSDGAAIYDLSGGQYDAINAGYPDQNRLRKTIVTDLTATFMRYATEYIDATGTVHLDMSHSVHLVSAFGGALTVTLPKASDAPGAEMMVKKIDLSDNIVTVIEAGGNGIDGKDVFLGGQHDYVLAISNGARWYIKSSNRVTGNTRYADVTGLYPIDMAVDTYLISSYSGAVTARLPPADAAESVGRTITIKKIDTSANAVTVTVQGSTGPDNSAQPLSSQYKAITVISDGGQWWITSKL